MNNKMEQMGDGMDQKDNAEPSPVRNVVEVIKNLSEKGLTLQNMLEIWEKAPTIEIIEAIDHPNIKVTRLAGFNVCLLRVENCGLVVMNSKTEGVGKNNGHPIVVKVGETPSREIEVACACCMPENHVFDEETKAIKYLETMRKYGNVPNEKFIEALENAKGLLGVDKIFMQSGGNLIPKWIGDIGGENPELIPVSKDAPVFFVDRKDYRMDGEVTYRHLSEKRED